MHPLSLVFIESRVWHYFFLPIGHSAGRTAYKMALTPTVDRTFRHRIYDKKKQQQ